MNTGMVRVQGLRELQRAFQRVSTTELRRLRRELRLVAEPVRKDAQTLASQNIRNIGDAWPLMRTGATLRVVYVAPKQRNKGGSKRPKFGSLLMDRAMQPALDRNQAEIELALGRMLDEITISNGF